MKARDIFLEENSLVEVKAPINVFGDIHGQFLDLLRHFDIVGYPGDTENKYIFLGDYVDRYYDEYIFFVLNNNQINFTSYGMKGMSTGCSIKDMEILGLSAVFMYLLNHYCI